MANKECPDCKARFRGDIVTCPIDGSVLREPVDEYLGRTIAGRYLVEELVGTGGMARVYRARHQVIGRDVALKFLDPKLAAHERHRTRFLGEARAANQISHEHIIDITDYGETEDGAVYMVMEYLDGRTVGDEIAKGRLGVRRALHVAEQVALGLARAHELGVVHRDVKPDNICLIERGRDHDFVKLLDFGIARIEQDMRITAAGTLLGTPEYIAPEQVRSGSASAATDMYALGCVLFEMLTGRLPFEGGTSLLLVKHLNDPPPAPSEFEEDIPVAVDALVQKMMAKDPEQRHRDAYHLAEELQRLNRALPSGAGGPARGSSPGAEHAREMTLTHEETSWHRMLAMFSALVREAHPTGDAPQWLSEALRKMATVTQELEHLRAHQLNAGKDATQRELDDADLHDQIGRALDELAADESKASRAIAELKLVARNEDSEAADIMAQMFEHARATHRPLRPGVIDAQEAARISGVLDATDALAENRTRAVSTRAQRDARQLEHKDLVFQIAALKEKLSRHHTARTSELDVAHEEVNRLDKQIGAKLETGTALAREISAYFDAFPELRQRIVQSGSAAALQARQVPDTADLTKPTAG